MDLAITEDGSTLIASNDKRIRFFDLPSGQERGLSFSNIKTLLRNQIV
jgi:hypothetical protein